MSDAAKRLLQTRLDDSQLDSFASRLLGWLTGMASSEEATASTYPESKARAILRAANAVDLPTVRLLLKQLNLSSSGTPAAFRLALFDLLSDSGLAEIDQVDSIAANLSIGDVDQRVPFESWLSLALATYAWRNEYPLNQLDPSFPPDPFSPAGQLIQQAASFIRKQTQRTATERDRIAKRLGFQRSLAGGTSSLEDMEPGAPIAPVPPYFRPPVPVTYPEISAETIVLAPDEGGQGAAAARQPAISIPSAEPSIPEDVRRMPAIRITADQVAGRTSSPSRVITPSPTNASPSNFALAVRNRFRRSREAFGSTKLRVRVQQHQDGAGIHGLQVRVRCTGVRSHVAGTTNREGTFICELPVRLRSGLTYDVEVTWPRDLGGEIERKSITLNADRTSFLLPFYHRYQ